MVYPNRWLTRRDPLYWDLLRREPYYYRDYLGRYRCIGDYSCLTGKCTWCYGRRYYYNWRNGYYRYNYLRDYYYYPDDDYYYDIDDMLLSLRI